MSKMFLCDLLLAIAEVCGLVLVLVLVIAGVTRLYDAVEDAATRDKE